MAFLLRWGKHWIPALKQRSQQPWLYGELVLHCNIGVHLVCECWTKLCLHTFRLPTEHVSHGRLFRLRGDTCPPEDDFHIRALVDEMVVRRMRLTHSKKGMLDYTVVWGGGRRWSLVGIWVTRDMVSHHIWARLRRSGLLQGGGNRIKKKQKNKKQKMTQKRNGKKKEKEKQGQSMNTLHITQLDPPTRDVQHMRFIHSRRDR